MENINKIDKNLHTLTQIESQGDSILLRYSDDPLETKNGKTITIWDEVEPGYFTPIDKYIIQ